MSATSIGAPWMPEPLSIVLAESGDYAEQSGLRVILQEHLLIVQAQIFGHSCELHMPIIDILEAVIKQTNQIGH